jgi:hypothetical protein
MLGDKVDDGDDEDVVTTRTARTTTTLANYSSCHQYDDFGYVLG